MTTATTTERCVYCGAPLTDENSLDPERFVCQPDWCSGCDDCDTSGVLDIGSQYLPPIAGGAVGGG